MNNRRMLTALGVIFLGLIGLFFYQEYDARNRREQAAAVPTQPPVSIEDLPLVFTSFSVLDIQAVRIESTTTDEVFAISRAEDGTWTAPGSEGELDADTATLIARTMVLLPYQQRVATDATTDFESYGFSELNPIGIFVQILLADGTTHAFAVGSRTPTQDAFYVLVDERDAIYLVEPRAIEFLRVQLRNPPIT